LSVIKILLRLARVAESKKASNFRWRLCSLKGNYFEHIEVILALIEPIVKESKA